MIVHKNGDLLKSNLKVIAHQTNCLGVMGAGIAKQIKNKWYSVFKAYRDYCLSQKDKHDILGKTQVIKTNNDNYVANLFGEYSFAESASPYDSNRNTDYKALEASLNLLKQWLQDNKIDEVGIPYKIGCGLAGGNWDDVVYPMIEKIFGEDQNITLYIYKL